MADINVSQLMQRFTQDTVANYKERAVPKAFLRSFFKEVVKETRFLNFNVKKYDESVAVNVVRGTESNLNKVSIEDNKIIDPPVFGEMINATELRSYETSFGSSNFTVSAIGNFMEELMEEMGLLQDKIERAQELQCAQVLDSGIITLTNGTNLDFGRKTASKVDVGSGSYWDTNASSAKPWDDFDAMFEFARTTGKLQGGNAMLIFGSKAYNALLGTDQWKTRASWLNHKLDDLKPAVRDSLGYSYKGRLDCGAYTADVFLYPEFYKASNGAMTPYINPRKVHLIGENINFVMGYAGLPMLPDGLANFAESARKQKKGKFVVNEYLDKLKKAWLFEVASCFVAMPVQINGFCTRTVTSA